MLSVPFSIGGTLLALYLTGTDLNVMSRMVLSLARMAAIVEGQVLSQDEMDVLMSDLFRSTNPNVSPDGKVIIVILAQESIGKMFL